MEKFPVLTAVMWIGGDGTALFGTTRRRKLLNLRETHQLSDGRVMLIYDIKGPASS